MSVAMIPVRAFLNTYVLSCNYDAASQAVDGFTCEVHWSRPLREQAKAEVLSAGVCNSGETKKGELPKMAAVPLFNGDSISLSHGFSTIKISASNIESARERPSWSTATGTG
nr:hypothetical protein CFP56_63519 [Quercus suber]